MVVGTSRGLRRFKRAQGSAKSANLRNVLGDFLGGLERVLPTQNLAHYDFDTVWDERVLR